MKEVINIPLMKSIKYCPNEKIVQIPAEFAFQMYGERFYVHKSIGYLGWTVSNYANGLHVYSDDTKSLTVLLAKEKLSNYNFEEFRKKIKKAVGIIYRAHKKRVFNDSRLPGLRETLTKYESELKENPSSLFAKGMVKNTKELIKQIENGKQ